VARLLCLVVIACAAGCASRHAGTLPLQPEALAQLHAGVDGRRAIVRYASLPVASLGTETRVFTGEVHVRGETLALAYEDTEIAVALTRVQEIDAHQPGRGAVKGAGVGLVMGLLAGGLAALFVSENCSEGMATCSGRRPMSTIVVFGGAGVLGIVAGAGIGAALGRGPVWRFSGN
jgi:hypothetical protein